MGFRTPTSTALKIKFPLRICSIKVTKKLETANLVTITKEILNGKLHFLCSANSGLVHLNLVSADAVQLMQSKYAVNSVFLG